MSGTERCAVCHRPVPQGGYCAKADEHLRGRPSRWSRNKNDESSRMPPPTVAELLALAEGPGIAQAPPAEPLTVEEMVSLELTWRGDDTRLGRQLRGLIAAVMVRDEEVSKARENARLWRSAWTARNAYMHHDTAAKAVEYAGALTALRAAGYDPDAPEGT